MKVIFLDLDGVLVTRRPGIFEERLLRNLQALVRRTEASIVLSSDWRRHPAAREDACRTLINAGLKVIGCTPCLSAFIAQRPTEILQWKADFCKQAPERDYDPITQWVAIDDRPLLDERNGHGLRGHFVRTHPIRGLTEAAVEECVRILCLDSAPSVSSAIKEPNSPAREVTPGRNTRQRPSWSGGSMGIGVTGRSASVVSSNANLPQKPLPPVARARSCVAQRRHTTSPHCAVGAFA